MMRSALLSLTILTAAAGCASAPMARPEATAVAEQVRVPMPVNPSDNGLTWDQQDLVNALAAEYKAVGHGPFVITYPAHGPNSDAAIAAIAQVRTRLYDAGLDWRDISGSAYDAAGRPDAPVIFSFQRYVAVAPACSQGWEDLAHPRAGETWDQFGCATANNLAAMVADPRDLVTARGLAAPDAARRQTVIDAWRRGEGTATRRSDEESGAVTEVVE